MYPPLPSGPRRHPVGQTCWASGDRTRDPPKDKLPSPPLKVAPSYKPVPLKLTPSKATPPLKLTPSKVAVRPKVALSKETSALKLAL